MQVKVTRLFKLWQLTSWQIWFLLKVLKGLLFDKRYKLENSNKIFVKKYLVNYFSKF